MKNENQILGELGEAFAMKYLKKNKYSILDCNYITDYGEIDIIAYKKGIYVFVEVKTRSTDFLLPQEAVNREKIQNIEESAREFRAENKLYDINFRFDIIEVFGNSPENFKVNHIIEAF